MDRRVPDTGLGHEATPPVAGPAAIRLGPGVTATTIRVGIIHSDNANAANEAYGVKGTGESLDPKRLFRIVFDDLNAHGGIAGRRVVPVFANVDGNTAFESSMQSVCSAFTEDTQVFAVLAGYFVNDTLRDCLDRHGVVLLDAGESIADQRTFERYRVRAPSTSAGRRGTGSRSR